MDDCIYITDDENPQDEDVEIVKLVKSNRDDSPVIIVESIHKPAEPNSSSLPRHQRRPHIYRYTRSQGPPPTPPPIPLIQPQQTSPTTITISPRASASPTPPITINPRPPPPQSPAGPKCTICLNAFSARKQEGFKIIITKCGHLFCDTCISGSMKALGRRCPKCRRAITVREKFIEVFDL